MLGYDESAFGAACAHTFRLLDGDGDGRVTAGDVRDAAKSVGAAFCCANERELACVMRSLVPPAKAVGGSVDFRPSQVALSRRHIEHWAAHRLTYDELREHEAREAAAAAAFATERMRAMGGGGGLGGGGGGPGGFGRRASTMAGGRRSSMYSH